MSTYLLRPNPRPMGSSKFNRKIMGIAWPVMLSSLSQTLLVNIDFVLVGSISTEALAAVGLAGTFLQVFLIICGSLSFGLSTAVSMRLGEQDRAMAGRMAVHGLIFGALLGGLLLLVSGLLIGRVLSAMDLEAEVRALSLQYSYLFIWGLLATGPAAMAGAVFGAYARTRHVMVSSLIMVGVNLLGDYVLIFGKLGLPAMGVRGAALASVMAVSASAAYLLITLLVLRRGLDLSLPRSPRLFVNTVKTIVRLGISTTIEWTLWLSGMVTLTVLLSPFGAVHLALFHVVIKVQSLLLWAGRGFSVANNAMIGRAHGGRQPGRIGIWHGHNMRLGLLSLLPGVLVLCVLPGWVFPFFIESEELRTVGNPYLIGMATAGVLVLRMFNTIVGSSLRSIGIVAYFIFLLLIALVLTIAAGYGMVTWLGWGFWGAITAQGLDEAFRGSTSQVKLRRLLHNRGASLRESMAGA